MPETDKPRDAAKDTRPVKSRDATRRPGRSKPAGDSLQLKVDCALRLADGQWLRPLSSAVLGEESAKSIAAAIRSGVTAADRLLRGHLPEGVLEVEFEYRGSASRWSQAFLPKLRQSIGDFLSSSAPRSDRRRLEGSLVRLRLSAELSDPGSAHRTSSAADDKQRLGRNDAATAERIQELIDRIRSLSRSTDKSDPLPTLNKLMAVLEEIRRLVGDEASAVFNCFTGERYDMETSKSLATGINQAARSLGLQFVFTAADGVERHAYLRCQATGRDRQPTFQFQSTAEDGTRTIHAAARTVPPLKPAPADSGWQHKLAGR